MKVPALLKNKYVCYALMALAALNVIGYVSVRAWECLALFALSGYSAHCYCKNVSLAVLAALFVANFVFGCGRVKENFEEMSGNIADDLKKAAKKAQDTAENMETLANEEGAKGNTDEAADMQGAADKVADASQQLADAAEEFKASKDACCEGGDWKGDLTDSQQASCAAAAGGADKAGAYCA